MRNDTKKHRTKAAALLWIVLGITVAAGTAGCASAIKARGTLQEESTDAQDTAPAVRNSEPVGQSGAGAETSSQPDSGASASPGRKESLNPALPASASRIEDFIPAGWELMDSVTPDYNQDGAADCIGVLQCCGEEEPGVLAPRILFAAVSAGDGSYRLDFQNDTLIRARAEGGVFGDPYMPLEAGRTSFTTNAFGGSAWKWSEAYTYTYRSGAWYLSGSESTSGYGPYITSEQTDNYETGVGVRRRRRGDFNNPDIPESSVPEEFDLVYQVSLDGPPDIVQAGKRRYRSWERLTDCPVRTLDLGEGVRLDPEAVKPPLDEYIRYRDENCMLYTFMDQDSGKYYLACYREAEQRLTVVAQGTEDMPSFDDCFAYKDHIYFSCGVLAQISRPDQKGVVITDTATVAVKLFRLGFDGGGREEIFEYRVAEPGARIQETSLPYLALICEAGGDEITMEVYVGGRPHPFYRMNLDGTNVQEIGFLQDEG